jgi:hypothetical protein
MHQLWPQVSRLLASALREGTGYSEFFLAVARAYAGGRGLSSSIHHLIKLLERLQPTPELSLRSALLYVEKLGAGGYAPVVVDCLGLPELYWLYAKLREAQPRALAVYAYVNETGRTSGFLEEVRKASMLQVATTLGGQKVSSLDRILHEVMSKPAQLEELARKAHTHFGAYVEELARLLPTRAFIVSDHGYDFAREGDLWYLEHGREPNILSKLAPLVVVEKHYIY